jgi:hypothetical protein
MDRRSQSHLRPTIPNRLSEGYERGALVRRVMPVNTATMQMKQLANSMRLFVRIFKRLVRCRHSNMSRAFTLNDEPYCLCLECGVRRRFDQESWTKLHPNFF